MKVNLNKNKKFLAIAITVFSVLNFTGCQDEIFNEIRDEIELEDSSIKGHINSIVRFSEGGTEYIVTQNGNIYYRPASVSTKIDWTRDTKVTAQATKVAANSNTLYALFTNWNEDVNEGEWVRSSTDIMAKTSVDGDWTKIHTVSGNIVVSLFCTNSANVSEREAYVRIASGTDAGVYKLTGATEASWSSATKWTSSSSQALGTANAATTPTASTNSCARLGSDTYFFNSLAATSNATSSTPATKIYYASGDDVYWATKTETETETFNETNKMDAGSDTIYSMSFTSDYLCLGTDSGYQAMPIYASGVPKESATDSFSNSSSTLSSYYELWAVLAVDPTETMANNIIFAAMDYSGSSSSTSAVFDNIGLWSYYPTRKWNRE
ncbi:MAG: hypothetical protein K5640_06190 [Treponema sp.]|nr:hypothetical protein [Treponema sp.]